MSVYQALDYRIASELGFYNPAASIIDEQQSLAMVEKLPDG